MSLVRACCPKNLNPNRTQQATSVPATATTPEFEWSGLHITQTQHNDWHICLALFCLLTDRFIIRLNMSERHREDKLWKSHTVFQSNTQMSKEGTGMVKQTSVPNKVLSPSVGETHSMSHICGHCYVYILMPIAVPAGKKAGTEALDHAQLSWKLNIIQNQLPGVFGSIVRPGKE